jgi:hypothetical protein
MTQETYRLAYEEAKAELQQINEHFEVLRIRREKVQQVVDALRPLFADVSLPETVSSADSTPFLVQQALTVPAESAPAIAEAFPQAAVDPEPAFAGGDPSSDPFQRRIDNALRHGLGSRDTKILPRGLNGLLSRA